MNQPILTRLDVPYVLLCNQHSMRGSIRKRGDRSWQLVYDLPRGGDGRRQQRSETVQGTKRQAQARLTYAFRRLVLGCGLGGLRFHDLRHAHASLLLGEGEPMHVVQFYFGH